jgi:hypothetical protein
MICAFPASVSATRDGRKSAHAIDIHQELVTHANGVKALMVWIERACTAPLEIGIE